MRKSTLDVVLESETPRSLPSAHAILSAERPFRPGIVLDYPSVIRSWRSRTASHDMTSSSARRLPTATAAFRCIPANFDRFIGDFRNAALNAF